ncbi:YqhG family protein [Laceyella putida]|uniref:YqhG family protein n=1 Tax=Laceyella putida TaxID=110101 RepID=A0ABW2RIS4_9BACL
MNQQQIRSFAERYLQLHDCHILESGPTYLTTRLSIQADKDLLDRPFYWMYVEKMNIAPQPVTLRFVFDPENHPPDLKGETLFFGAPRFKEMLRSTQKHGRFVRLYQEPQGRGFFDPDTLAYTPWLGVNYKLSYICDQKKDILIPVGINLISGQILPNFYQQAQAHRWISKLPAHRHLLPPHLSLSEAVGELEYHIQERIQGEDLTWAEQAKERCELELEQLEAFYPEPLTEEARRDNKQRREEIIWQYYPRAELHCINAGLFYAETNAFS